MNSEQDSIEQHLWENFLIDQNIYDRMNLKIVSDDEKTRIYQNRILNNFFLLRIQKDLGFYSFVLENVNQNKEIQLLVKKYVYKLLFDRLFEINELFTKNSEKEKNNNNILNESLISVMNDIVRLNLVNFDLYNKSMDYISRKYDESLDSNRIDNDEALAISQLLNDFRRSASFTHQFLEESPLFTGISTTDKLTSTGQKYSYEKIKFIDIYNKFSIYPAPEYRLFYLILPADTFIESLLDIFADFADITSLSSVEILSRNKKAIADSVSIAALLWFNKKTEHEKLGILNRQYPFTVNYQLLETYFKIGMENNFKNLYILGEEFLKNNYIVEAEIIFQYILDTCHEDDLRLSCYDELGNIFNEQEKYVDALECYLESYKLGEKKSDDSFSKVKILINIGEMYYRLGNIEKAEQYFSSFKDRINGHPKANDKYMIYDLANAYRRVHNFEKEYEIRVTLQRDALKPPSKKEIEDHIKSENYLKQMECFRIGERLFNNFQLEKALKFFLKANEIEIGYNFNEIKTLKYLALYHLYKENFPKATNYLKKIVGLNNNDILDRNDISEAHLYLGLLKIRENNLEAGINNIVKTLEIGKDHYTMIKLCIIYLIAFNKQDTIYEIVNRIESKLSSLAKKENSMEDRSSCYDDIGLAFQIIGFYDEALSYYDLGLSKEVHSQGKAYLFLGKGNVFLKMGKNKDAISMFKEANKLNNGHILLQNDSLSNMALCYSNQLNFIKAKECLEELLRSTPNDSHDNKIYLNLKEKYDALSRDEINYTDISYDEIKKILESAERLLLNEHPKLGTSTDFDFSASLIYYGKALELLLHIHISSKIKEKILEKWIYIPDEYWYGFNGFDKLTPSLKDLLQSNKSRSISIGGWKGLIEEINNVDNIHINNPVFEMFKNIVSKKYNKEELEKIKQACAMVAGYRNASAHKDIKTKEKVLAERKNIIEHINRVIEIIHNKSI